MSFEVTEDIRGAEYISFISCRVCTQVFVFVVSRTISVILLDLLLNYCLQERGVCLGL